jgi:Uma2 family endonuclease
MPPALTAEQFDDQRPDLPEGGRWVELNAGRVVQFDPPDPAHGNVVLNLSKTLADYLGKQAPAESGYVCFELGLLVARRPDTVHFPAASYFVGSRFVEADKTYTDVVPRLVVEIASTNSRRRGLADRVNDYLKWGVPFVWFIDTVERQVHVVQQGQATETYDDQQSLDGSPVFRGLQIPVAELFQTPSWWK